MSIPAAQNLAGGARSARIVAAEYNVVDALILHGSGEPGDLGRNSGIVVLEDIASNDGAARDWVLPIVASANRLVILDAFIE